MKKLLFLLFLIPVFAAAQKTTGGNYIYIAQRYEWLAGVFEALGLPAGSGPAAFTSGQEMRAGAVYFDSLGVDAGFYIWTGSQWVLQGTPLAAELPDELIQPGYVTYSGTGLKFYISPSIIRVDGVIYGTTYDSVTLSASDPDDPRKDVIYVATTGIEVAEGTPAGPAAEPQLEAGQFKLTVIDVPATATTPGITTNIIWDENTESVVTNTGTTTDPDNTTNVYRLTKSVNVTNIGNGDIVHLTLPSTIDLNNYNSISGFIDLKAGMSGSASLRIRFFNGATAVSNEVVIGLNRSSTDYQGWSVPLSQFTFSNTFVDRVNIRYIHSGSVVVHAGFFLDYIHLVNGFIQPGGGSGTPLAIGPIDTKTPNSNGATIENGYLYFWNGTQQFPGLMSPSDKTKLDSIKSDYLIINKGNGVYITVYENDSTIGVKSFKLIGGTLIDTDSTFGVDLSGFGGFFSPDQTSTGNTTHDAGGFNFALNNVGDLGLNSENTNLIANSDFTINGDSVRMNSTSGRITFPNLTASDDTTNFKPISRDPATGRLRQASYWPGGGGSLDTTSLSDRIDANYFNVEAIDDTSFVIKRPNGTEDTIVIVGQSAVLPSDLVYETTTQTLTNKRWVPRVGSTTSSATPTINTDDVDIYKLTAQAVDITSFTTNLSGTPNDGEILEIQITGTAARAITWGASFVASTVSLPSTTVTTATLTVVFQWFTTSSYGNNKWVCVNSF